MILILGITFFTTGWLVPATPAMAQAVTGSEHQWIRPADGNDPAIWGIRDGIVFGLWPYGIESGQDAIGGSPRGLIRVGRSEEHTSELQSLMRSSYAVFCLKQKTKTTM